MSKAAESPGAGAARGRWSRVRTWARENGAQAARELLVNFAAPACVYAYAKAPLGDVHALMAASAPPIAWTIAEFARHRKLDALSILVLTGIALSLLAFLGGGGVRALQLREQLVMAAIGLVFLASAAINRPLIYQLARARIARASSGQAQSFEARRPSPAFRRAMMTMTLAWGIGLIVEAGISCALVFVLSIQAYLIAGPILGYASLGGLTIWTFRYARRALA